MRELFIVEAKQKALEVNLKKELKEQENKNQDRIEEIRDKLRSETKTNEF